MHLNFKTFSRLFLTLLLLHLAVLYKEPNGSLFYVSKPALLLSLIAYYFQMGFKPMSYPQKLFSMGLIFSLMGDVLLMWDNLFVFGLGAFLIAQLAYTFAFYRSNFGKKGWVQQLPILALPVLIFTAGLIYFLRPTVGALLPAIVVYAVVISLMLISALNRKGLATEFSFNNVVLGAVLFVTSDSLLAINKFHTEFAGANIAVMLTYGLAQYFLVRGFRKMDSLVT